MIRCPTEKRLDSYDFWMDVSVSSEKKKFFTSWLNNANSYNFSKQNLYSTGLNKSINTMSCISRAFENDNMKFWFSDVPNKTLSSA